MALTGSEAVLPADAHPGEIKSDDVLSVEHVQEKPWKFIGYRGYTNFVSSDVDFFILRRFDKLNVRVSLTLQDELSELEEELAVIDRRCSQLAGHDFNNGTIRGDVGDRRELISRIEEKLAQYNTFLAQQSMVRNLRPASDHNINSLKNWHENHQACAIMTEEQRYLDHRQDLVQVVQQDKTPVRRLIDRSQWLTRLRLWRSQAEKDRMVDVEAQPWDMTGVYLFSERRLNLFAAILTILVGVAMLLFPLWILNGLQERTEKLAVIAAFVFVFLVTLSAAMVAKPFEALAATAAYAAVLMVFVQLAN